MSCLSLIHTQAEPGNESDGLESESCDALPVTRIRDRDVEPRVSGSGKIIFVNVC